MSQAQDYSAFPSGKIVTANQWKSILSHLAHLLDAEKKSYDQK